MQLLYPIMLSFIVEVAILYLASVRRVKNSVWYHLIGHKLGCSDGFILDADVFIYGIIFDTATGVCVISDSLFFLAFLAVEDDDAVAIIVGVDILPRYDVGNILP